MNNFNLDFSLSELFDAVYYMNKMAKVVPLENRIIGNSLFYKIKSAIIYDLISYADMYGLTVKVKSRDFQCGHKINYWLALEISNDVNHLDIHTEENDEIVYLLDKFYHGWQDNIQETKYNRTEDFPEFDNDKYINSYNIIMSAMRKMGIFVQMYNSHAYPYDAAIYYISHFYPEIQIVTNKKLNGNKAHDSQILADVFINGKKVYTQKKMQTICVDYFENMIAKVEKENNQK